MTNEQIAARLREIKALADNDDTPTHELVEMIGLRVRLLLRELEAAPAGVHAESAGDLPPHDPTKPNRQQGLYGKFHIARTDGTDAPGGKHHGCDYFVLDVTHDKHAKAALAAYADAVEATHPQLAADMRSRWGLTTQPAGDAGMPQDVPKDRQEPPAIIVKIGDALRQALPVHPCASVREARRSSCPAEIVVMIQTLGAYLRDAQAAIESRDERIASLEADLREEQDRRQAMRSEWGAEVADLLRKREADAQYAAAAMAEARGRIAELESQWMPLMGTGLAVRMDLLDAAQADRNHGQTLQRLAERGGLVPSEAMAIIERRRWRDVKTPDAMAYLAATSKPSGVA